MAVNQKFKLIYIFNLNKITPQPKLLGNYGNLYISCQFPRWPTYFPKKKIFYRLVPNIGIALSKLYLLF